MVRLSDPQIPDARILEVDWVKENQVIFLLRSENLGARKAIHTVCDASTVQRLMTTHSLCVLAVPFTENRLGPVQLTRPAARIARCPALEHGSSAGRTGKFLPLV